MTGQKYKKYQSKFVRKYGSDPKIHVVLDGDEFSLCGYPHRFWTETDLPVTCEKCIAKLAKEEL